MKNSFSVVWGGKEENEYLQIPMDFRGNMTLTLKRGWSKDDAPQPQGCSLTAQGDGTGHLWQSAGKGTGCSEAELWHTESPWLWLCPAEIPCGQCLLHPSAKPSVLPGEPWCSCSAPPQKATPGVALAKTTKGKGGGGVGRGRETEGKMLILCTLSW